ncbi:MAG: hypothetical protein Q8Q20_00575 [bacterium]|nr:hypothetical protein [bacterium]
MNFTESSTWFYTLSTISQTCAAILALGGTFVVFKLDKVQTAIDNYRGRVVRIVQLWRIGARAPDEFIDKSEEEILGEYKRIVTDNAEEVFDRNGIVELYQQLEGVRILTMQEQGSFNMDNGVRLDHDERKRWSNRMADLLESNIRLKNRIYSMLKSSIVLLAVTIVVSIGLLISAPLKLPVGINTLAIVILLAILSIGYSTLAVWKIARSKPIL